MDNDDNPNPVVYKAADTLTHRSLWDLLEPDDVSTDADADAVTTQEVYESLRWLSDPEHPNLTLEQLKVVEVGRVWVEDRRIYVRFTPTVPTCSVATLIGLSIKAKLQRSLPRRYKIDVDITPGSHNQEDQVNKQLGDKERVAAALENPSLRNLINTGIANTDRVSDVLQLV